MKKLQTLKCLVIGSTLACWSEKAMALTDTERQETIMLTERGISEYQSQLYQSALSDFQTQGIPEAVS